MPLDTDARATIAARLEDRWGASATAAGEGGLAPALAAFFDGKRVADADNADAPAGPGCTVVQDIDA